MKTRLSLYNPWAFCFKNFMRKKIYLQCNEEENLRSVINNYFSQLRIKIMNKEKIKAILQDAAARKSEVTYSSIFLNLNHNYNSNSIKNLLNVLIEIGDECLANNEPPVNVLVSQTGHLFSPQLFDWYCERYFPDHIFKNPRKTYKAKFFKNQQIACFEFWTPKLTWRKVNQYKNSC